MTKLSLFAMFSVLSACGLQSPLLSSAETNNPVSVPKQASAATTIPTTLIAVAPESAVAQRGKTRTSSTSSTASPRLLSPVAQRQNSSNVDMCEGSITHSERVNIPAVAKPPFMKFYKDPAFGSKVIRITDSGFGEVRKPPYSTMQAWNADESLLLLYRGGNDDYHMLLDGHTYKPVRKLNITPTDLEEVFWSHTDPDVFYYVSEYASDLGQFKRYNVSTGKATVLADLGKHCAKGEVPVAGSDVHMQSLDDDLFGFRCEVKPDQYIMMSYRLSTGEIITQPIGEGTPFNQWYAPMPAPSGKRFWMQGAALATDLKVIEKKMDVYKSDEHSSLGQTHDGQDALYQVAFDPSPNGCNGDIMRGVGHLVQHNLETGECRPIINESDRFPYTTSSSHASAQAYLRPGWVAMSSIGSKDQYEFFTNKRKAPALLSEIYLADTDPKHRVTCRLAHHRSFGKEAENGDYPSYFGEPHATISPSGTRIIFGSDWYDSGAVDSYVIELPGYVRPK